MKITEDFIGNETKTLTKTKISTILRWWGFNPDSYSTWGNARSDMNNILSGTPTGEISDRERASTFLSKINYVNDTDAIIGDTIFAAGVPGVWYDPSDLSTLFQDAAGTIPVTGVEQPVGLMLDKSRSLGPNLAPSTASLSGWTLHQTGGSVTVVDGGLFLNTTGTGLVAASFTGLISSARYTFEFEVVSVSGLMYLEHGAGGASRVLSPGKHRWCVTSRTSFYLRNAGAAAKSGSLLIKNIVVRVLPGSHAVQATTTARPILSARYNLLTSTDTLVGGGWVALAPNTTVTPGFSSPLGENTAARVRMPALSESLLNHSFNATAGHTYRLRFLARRGGSSTNFSFGFATTNNGALGNSTVTNLGDVWQEFFVDYTAPASGQLWAGIDNVNNGQAIDVLIAGIDLRLAVDVPSLPSYQRVVSSSEYSTEGFPYYLRFDGVDDHLNLDVLNMSAASTAGYFSAITKLSDVSTGRWYSHSLSSSAGSVRLLAPANPGQASVRVGFYSSSGLKEVGGQSHAAPITLTVRSEIEPGGDGLWVTHNNGAKLSTSVDPTTFSADGEACIGAQVANGSRVHFLNGRLYALIVVGRKSSGSEQAVIETFLRNKSRAY